MTIRRPARSKPRIELIPMIDTIFFILVFFVVASLSMVRQEGLSVDLPRTASGTGSERARLTMTVRADGSLFLNKRPVTRADLLPALRQHLGANPDLTVLVNADRQSHHGRVVEVMDAARLAGARRLMIATTPKGPGSP